MAAGNWVPELVELAGGVNIFGKAGIHSPWLDWKELADSDPDVIVVNGVRRRQAAHHDARAHERVASSLEVLQQCRDRSLPEVFHRSEEPGQLRALPARGAKSFVVRLSRVRNGRVIQLDSPTVCNLGRCGRPTHEDCARPTRLDRETDSCPSFGDHRAPLFFFAPCPCSTRQPQTIAKSMPEVRSLKMLFFKNLVFNGWYGHGIRVLDISNPHTPREVGYALTLPHGIARTYPVFRDGLIYWVDNRTGLHVGRYMGPRADELPGPGTGIYEGNATSPHR